MLASRSKVTFVGEGHREEKKGSLVDPLATPGQLEAPHFLPCPWNVGFPCLPHSPRPLQGPNLDIVMW